MVPQWECGATLGPTSSWAHSWHAGCPGMKWPWIPACGRCAGLRSLWRVSVGVSCAPTPSQAIISAKMEQTPSSLGQGTWDSPVIPISLSPEPLSRMSTGRVQEDRTLAVTDAGVDKPLAWPKHILHHGRTLITLQLLGVEGRERTQRVADLGVRFRSVAPDGLRSFQTVGWVGSCSRAGLG